VDSVTSLSLARIAVGIGAYGSPEMVGKIFGIDAHANPQAPYVSRMFASREIALGAVTLLARGTARRNLTIAGVLIDIGDGATGALGIKQQMVPARTGAVLIGAAVYGVLSGLRGLRASR
jgi:hypothetical protein